MIDKKRELLKQLVQLESDKPTICIKEPKDAFFPLAKWADKSEEHFLMMTLDTSYNIIEIHELTKGLIDRVLIDSRIIFRKAIMDNAHSIILAHNHPAGSLHPSLEDKKLAERLNGCSRILGIAILDHLIISKEGFYSRNYGEVNHVG